MAAWGGDVAAAPANGAGEEGQLRRAAAGATELETRKKKYGVGRENETDPVVGSDKFSAHRSGRRKMEKLGCFFLSLLVSSSSGFLSLWLLGSGWVWWRSGVWRRKSVVVV